MFLKYDLLLKGEIACYRMVAYKEGAGLVKGTAVSHYAVTKSQQSSFTSCNKDI